MPLAADELAYQYPSRRGTGPAFACRGLSLTIPDGSVTGLLGPNGSGKTTLLKLLAGLLTPEAGAVRLDGRPLGSMTRREVARRIALVPQETHPAFDYSVLEMVLMGRHPHLGLFELEGPSDVACAYDALRATGTDHLAHRPYLSLSGGEKQRVVIAAALAQDADVLLLDEPTASLDLAYQLEIAALVTRLARDRGLTAVLATHDLNLASAVCRDIVLMREGRIAAQGEALVTLTAPMIREVYGVDAEVQRHERAGRLTIVPVGRVR